MVASQRYKDSMEEIWQLMQQKKATLSYAKVQNTFCSIYWHSNTEIRIFVYNHVF